MGQLHGISKVIPAFYSRNLLINSFDLIFFTTKLWCVLLHCLSTSVRNIHATFVVLPCRTFRHVCGFAVVRWKTVIGTWARQKLDNKCWWVETQSGQLKNFAKAEIPREYALTSLPLCIEFPLAKSASTSYENCLEFWGDHAAEVPGVPGLKIIGCVGFDFKHESKCAWFRSQLPRFPLYRAKYSLGD